jgi:transposase
MASGRLAVEAMGCNRWFVNSARERGWDVLVVNANKLALRREGKKTDRRDAYEIARRLFLGDLDRCARSYYPTDAEYGQRKLTRVEHSLIRKRTSTIAEIRGLLNAYKVVAPSSVLWTKKSIAWLRTVTMPTDEMTFALQILVEDLASTQGLVARMKRRIEQAAAEDRDAQFLIRELPSVAAHTALMLRSELGDADRFRNARAVACYAGVVPRVTASADVSHHGAMTKRGNAHLRWIAGQWAVRLLAKNEVVQAWARPRYRRMHKNKLRVALTRRLIVGVWVLLSRGEVFSLEKCLGLAA